MLITLRKKAQSTAEYVMLFAIVLGAVAMARSYLSKAIAGGIQAKAIELMAKTNASLYDTTLDNKNVTKSARQNNDTSHQDSELTKDHAFNANHNSDEVSASIGGDLQEAQDEADAFNIKDGTWSERGK